MQLKIVVLPAPLGPISPWMRPVSIAKLTPSTARSPPKFRARSWTDRQVFDVTTIGPGASVAACDSSSRRGHRALDRPESAHPPGGPTPSRRGADATGAAPGRSRPPARRDDGAALAGRRLRGYTPAVVNPLPLTDGGSR